MQTQCPHCGASFRITQAQLTKASGRVRCGACKQVFNALEGLVDPVVSAQSAASAPRSDQVESSPYVRALEKGRRQTDRSTTEEDDLVFQDDPAADGEDEGYTGRRAGAEEFSDDFKSLSGHGESRQRFSDEPLEDDPQVSDERWAEAMLQNLNEEKRSSRTVTPPASTVPGINRANLDSDGMEVAPLQEEAPLHADPRPNLSHLRADPLRVKVQKTPQKKRGGWMLVGLLLVLLLAGQGLWLNWDRLVREPGFRDLVTTACDGVENMGIGTLPRGVCELPELIDLARLRGEDLFVRPHPTERNGLILDAQIVNEADFAQPMPALDVRFYDINDNILAQRTFLPSEYLAGEALHMQRLEPDIPLQIALVLENPGPQAANYTLDFLPADAVQAAVGNNLPDAGTAADP